MEQLNRIKLKFINSIHHWIVGVAFATPFFSCSQINLVVNPNCDIYDTCPETTGQIYRANNWSNFNSWGTTDYFNVCGVNPPVTIPSYFGFQMPLSGEGYIHAGIVTSHFPKNFTFWTGVEFGNVYGGESFIGSLKEPLKNVPYKIEFYVSFSKVGFDDGMGNGDGRIATNAFDLLLLNSNESYYTSPVINQNDVININKENLIINDTLNWVKLSTCFIPKGGETYFAIGAFRDTNDIILEFSGASFSNVFGGSYYFDNFSITECDTCCLGEFPYSDHVNVSNNPSSSNNPTTFTIVLNANTSATLDIYDSAGRLVARNEFNDLLSNYQVDAQLAIGVYHYVLRTSNGVTDVGKVLVSL